MNRQQFFLLFFYRITRIRSHVKQNNDILGVEVDGGQVNVENCEFVQEHERLKESPRFKWRLRPPTFVACSKSHPFRCILKEQLNNSHDFPNSTD